MTPAQQVALDAMHSTWDEATVARMLGMSPPRAAVFVVTQQDSLPWGVFMTLREAQECAQRVCRAYLHPAAVLGWESVPVDRDPAATEPDPIVARWRSGAYEDDDCFYIDQMAVGEQGFAPDPAAPKGTP